jgi:hypothetical protein
METVSVEVAEPPDESVRLVELSEAIGQFIPGQAPTGPPVTVCASVTVSWKPFRLVAVIVEVPMVLGGRTSTEAGMAETLKSGTKTVITGKTLNGTGLVFVGTVVAFTTTQYRPV